VQESQVIRGWIERGRQQGIMQAGRKNILTLVRLRLHDPVPEEVRLAVERTNDLATLDRWFDAALIATTLDEFLSAMRQQS
jgi:hypothetical protein